MVVVGIAIRWPEGNIMTETSTRNIDEALELIDAGLGRTMSRELMSTAEVTDLLLDLRSILANSVSADAILDEPIPAPIG